MPECRFEGGAATSCAPVLYILSYIDRLAAPLLSLLVSGRCSTCDMLALLLRARAAKCSSTSLNDLCSHPCWTLRKAYPRRSLRLAASSPALLPEDAVDSRRERWSYRELLPRLGAFFTCPFALRLVPVTTGDAIDMGLARALDPFVWAVLASSGVRSRGTCRSRGALADDEGDVKSVQVVAWERLLSLPCNLGTLLAALRTLTKDSCEAGCDREARLVGRDSWCDAAIPLLLAVMVSIIAFRRSRGDTAPEKQPSRS